MCNLQPLLYIVRMICRRKVINRGIPMRIKLQWIEKALTKYTEELGIPDNHPDRLVLLYRKLNMEGNNCYRIYDVINELSQRITKILRNKDTKLIKDELESLMVHFLYIHYKDNIDTKDSLQAINSFLEPLRQAEKIKVTNKSPLTNKDLIMLLKLGAWYHKSTKISEKNFMKILKL